MARVIAGALLVLALTGAGAQAQKTGGVLRVYHRDSPASMSIIEEASNSVSIPMMAVFNNLVLYDQHVAQNSLGGIVPDLAESWSWNKDGMRLTFKLRDGVKWHDGKLFTAEDVKCTWDLLTGRSTEKLRANPRRSWWGNIAETAVDGPLQATFVLKRPQPAVLALLASGQAPVYPCHVPPAQMRQHPIGTGPFKFVEFRPNESIKLARNPDYWKPGRPYLDGIEYTIIPNRSTAILGFVAGQFDLTFPYEITAPLIADIEHQAPQAVCELVPANSSTNLLVNRDAPPFDNADLRRALALALDRKSFIETSWLTDRAISAARWSRRPRASGACRPKFWPRCPATVRTSPRTAPPRARSCKSLATGRTSASRSRSRCETSRPTAIRRSS
jgi:peptide/nickel transport system substrate-binding protein